MGQNLLDFGRPVVGIDPGSSRMGVAYLSNDGTLKRSWTVQPPRTQLQARQQFIYTALRRILFQIRRECGDDEIPVVYIEEGIYKSAPGAIATLGEMRGLAMAAAWAAGFKVKKMYPLSWKKMLMPQERLMKKDAAYVSYWSRVLAGDFSSPDEVDAVLIAKRAVGW